MLASRRTFSFPAVFYSFITFFVGFSRFRFEPRCAYDCECARRRNIYKNLSVFITKQKKNIIPITKTHFFKDSLGYARTINLKHLRTNQPRLEMEQQEVVAQAEPARMTFDRLFFIFHFAYIFFCIFTYEPCNGS